MSEVVKYLICDFVTQPFSEKRKYFRPHQRIQYVLASSRTLLLSNSLDSDHFIIIIINVSNYWNVALSSWPACIHSVQIPGKIKYLWAIFGFVFFRCGKWMSRNLQEKKMKTNDVVIPLNSNTFSNWRRKYHVRWVKTPFPRGITTWIFDSHLTRSCILQPRQVCVPAHVKKNKYIFSVIVLLLSCKV